MPGARAKVSSNGLVHCSRFHAVCFPSGQGSVDNEIKFLCVTDQEVFKYGHSPWQFLQLIKCHHPDFAQLNDFIYNDIAKGALKEDYLGQSI